MILSFDKNYTPHLILFILVYGVLNALYNTTLPLYIDEAYYWLWSQNPSLSYFDHPPMVAWFISLFSIPGDTAFWIRLSTVFCMSLSAWYIFMLAESVYDHLTGIFATVIFLILPATGMGYAIITPDSPLTLFWSMALYYSHRAFTTDRWACFIAAGICIGLALLSKYTAVLFLGSLGIYLLMRERERFLDVKAWEAILIALVIFSPVLIWNYQNDWISFAFQYDHGTGEAWKIQWDDFGEYLGGQFITYSPVFFTILLWALWKWEEWYFEDAELLLVLSFLFPFLFFVYKGLWTRVELNWGIMAFIGIIPLTARFLLIRKMKNTAIAGFALCIILVAGMKYPLLFGLDGKQNPQNRIFGYQEAAAHVESLLKPGDVPMADHLTTASALTYFLPGHPRTYIPSSTRFSQYDFWDEEVDFSKLRGVYISKDNRLSELREIFGHEHVFESPKFTARKKGFKERTFRVYEIRDR